MSDSYVNVTLVRSPIGIIPRHRGTLRALGLRRVRAVRRHKVTPVLNGMLRQVGYLIDVREEK